MLNKILLDGFGVTADLYSKYAETYIHYEKEERNDENIEVDENKSGKQESIEANCMMTIWVTESEMKSMF